MLYNNFCGLGIELFSAVVHIANDNLVMYHLSHRSWDFLWTRTVLLQMDLN